MRQEKAKGFFSFVKHWVLKSKLLLCKTKNYSLNIMMKYQQEVFQKTRLG